MLPVKDKMGRSLKADEVVKKGTNRIYNILLDFKLMILRFAGLIPSHLFRLLFYRLAGIKISRGSRIHLGATFFQPNNIKIGQDTIIGYHCFLDGRAQLTIGDHVDIASEVMIYNSQHDIDDPKFQAIEKPVVIKDYVFIGPRVIILPGVTIGRGAVVGAGAVVLKDVPDNKVVGGVPAKEIRDRKLANYQYRLGRARLFQ